MIRKDSYLWSWQGSCCRLSKSLITLSENGTPDRSNSARYGFERLGFIMENIISPKDQISAFLRSSWSANFRSSNWISGAMNTGVPRQVDSVFVCRNEFVCISRDRLRPKSASLQTMGHSA